MMCAVSRGSARCTFSAAEHLTCSQSSRSSAAKRIVNLRNRTGEERRRQTLGDKRHCNFVSNDFTPNFTFL